MEFVLASDWLTPLGQLAAIILALYLFLSILLGLALAAILMFGFAWIREKVVFFKNLRSSVNELNRALVASQHGDPLPQEVADNRLIQTVARIPGTAARLPGTVSAVEQKVEQGSERVASAVIEFRARTAMAREIVRAFFLPQTTRPHLSVEQAAERERRQLASTEAAREIEPPLYEEEMTIMQSPH